MPVFSFSYVRLYFTFFRKDVILDNYIWALCLLPGALGIALTFNSCRKSRRHCKPVTDEDEVEGPRRGAPHPCALPAHTLLLVFVVVCLVMHASALLFCQVRQPRPLRIEVSTSGVVFGGALRGVAAVVGVLLV